MKKIFLIGWKDLKLAFRDRAGLIFMILAPLVLTIGMGFVTGGFSSTPSSISAIPVTVVNLDEGELGLALVKLLQSDDLKSILTATLVEDPAAARQAVAGDQTAAAVIIPSGFTASIIPAPSTGQAGPLVQIELYTNPTRPTSAGIIKTVLERFLSQVEVGRISGEIVIRQLLAENLIQPQQAVQAGAQIGTLQAAAMNDGRGIIVNQSAGQNQPVEFNILAYMAPGMALMFLMYTVSNGGRALLYEKNHGTLLRLLVSPARTAHILAGKVFGVYLTGVLQMLILIIACALLFQLSWGNPVSVLLIVLTAVVGAVGWGSLITALAKTSGQVAAIGSAVMLTFGILGGSFFSIENMPAWYKIVSRVTPNAWGISAFNILAGGGSLIDILPAAGALLIMGFTLFSLAAFIIKRRGLFQN